MYTKLRRYWFFGLTVPFLLPFRSFQVTPVPVLSPFRSFLSWTGLLLFSGNPGHFPERDGYPTVKSGTIPVFTGPYRSLPVHTGLIPLFLCKTSIGPVFKKRTGVMHRYWTGNRPVLYWSNTGPFHRYWSGNFRALPFHSVTGPFPFRLF